MDAVREIPQTAGYKKGDVLVLFGELFSKGYANGIVDEAEKLGMTIIRSTVGRRDSDGQLRALTAEESQDIPKPFINIPLEAGFDMEPDSKGKTPCDHLKGIKMSGWNQVQLDWASIQESQNAGVERFRSFTTKYMNELEQHIPKDANVLFVHTMAGGVPRAKILMPVMNKVFKGKSDRHIPSKDLFESDIGKFSQMNFSEVTANTLDHLVDLSTPLREKISQRGNKVSYVAYGYHGTEVLIDGAYQWQTYTPYFQGWAKMELEDYCKKWTEKSVSCTVFNCPEILTNSSSIFQGVEVSLYPLLGAIEKEGGNSDYCKAVLEKCKKLLKSEHSFQDIMEFTAKYVKNHEIVSHSDFNNWPQHNSQSQMEFMLESSNTLFEMHVDPKDLMTFPLSEEVFKATGQIMLHESWSSSSPVLWLNHDIIAKQMAH